MVLKKYRIFTFKIAFFGGFKNDNILSSKSYTGTKSEISPQRKLGSLRNFKLKFKRSGHANCINNLIYWDLLLAADLGQR